MSMQAREGQEGSTLYFQAGPFNEINSRLLILDVGLFLWLPTYRVDDDSTFVPTSIN